VSPRAWLRSCVTALLRGQQANASALTMAGDVTTPLSLSLADVKKLPRKQLEFTQKGKTLKYEGVLRGLRGESLLVRERQPAHHFPEP
jgi:hypothetical protein